MGLYVGDVFSGSFELKNFV